MLTLSPFDTVLCEISLLIIYYPFIPGLLKTSLGDTLALQLLYDAQSKPRNHFLLFYQSVDRTTICTRDIWGVLG